MPALAALLLLLFALDLHQKVEQGQFLPAGTAPLRGLETLRASYATHDLTAEMLLPSGEILALDQVGPGAHAAVRLVTLAPDGRSGRVLWLWQMHTQLQAPWVLERGFLHSFYYQALSRGYKPGGTGDGR